MSWSKLCRPKIEGGLGLKRFEEWNKACLSRNIWMLFIGSDSLWIAWVKNSLFKGKSFWMVKSNTTHSWCWKKLLKLRPIIRPMIMHEIGNGRDTFLWHDLWHPQGPLLLTYGPRIVYDSGLPENAKVLAFINGTASKWPPARSDALFHIQMQLCGKIEPSLADDKFFWASLCFQKVSSYRYSAVYLAKISESGMDACYLV